MMAMLPAYIVLWQEWGQPANPAMGQKMDQEYMSLMAELGEGPPPQQVITPTKYNLKPVFNLSPII